jgi:glycogen phosphorylase
MQLPKVAFVSMEFGLQSDMKTYCGGLGILSGDIFKSTTDLGYQMVGFSLLCKEGYFKQSINGDEQTEEPDIWDHNKLLNRLDPIYKLELINRTINYQLLQYNYTSPISNTTNSIYFIDTDLDSNTLEIRNISKSIYPPDKNVWYLQQFLLGLATPQIAHNLNLNVDIYHLNESHAVSLALALMKIHNDVTKVRESLVFTTHTPLEGANQKMNIDLLQTYLKQDLIDIIPKELIIDNTVNYTSLAIHFAKVSNAVAKRHKQVTTQMYPDKDIKYITNGVHIPTWACDGLAKIYDQYLGNWRIDNNALRMVGVIPDQLLWDNHMNNKSNLVSFLESIGYEEFDKHAFTIGFARRTTGYKRADFVLTQVDRLRSIAKKYGKLQIVFSGKAYPTDIEGKALVHKLLQATKLSDENLKIAFIPDYDMDIAKKIILGVDLWLNNPLPPLEASGTSGMKASLNGIPNFSILDGWWVEGHLEGQTGWNIGKDLCVGDSCQLIEIEDLYSKLENQIYESWTDRKAWSRIIKSCIALNGTYFNTNRVVQEYFLISYLK